MRGKGGEGYSRLRKEGESERAKKRKKGKARLIENYEGEK